MTEIPILDDPRLTSRRLQQAVGKSVFKTLAEPVTNSDDSYRRAIQDGKLDLQDRHPIFITVDKTKDGRRRLSIVDWAEGMTDEEMGQLFEVYGKEKSGLAQGQKVRGLFGQGITDVLLYHKNGTIHSIKDKKVYECRFYLKDGKKMINPRPSAMHLRDARKLMNIPEGDGTMVSFELADGVRWPQKIVERLERFSMLRLINADENREVHFIERKNKRIVNEAILKYKFPKGTQILSWEGFMNFETYKPVKIELELWRSDDELPAEEKGLLVFDEENAVYDLTLFGLEAFPGHDQFFGRLRLTGAREIIREKLNQEQGAEAILSDDREGFNLSHNFYHKLQELVQEKLRPILINQNKQAINKEKSEDLTKNEKEVFDEFNEIFNEIINESKPRVVGPIKPLTPPEHGLEFDRKNIKATTNKNYTLALNINTSLIGLGSKIKLSSDSDNVTATPQEISISKSMLVSEGLARTYVTISGDTDNEVARVSAVADKYSAGLLVEVIPETFIYPETIQFEPDNVVIRPGKTYQAKLFINTEKIPPGGRISLSHEGIKSNIPHEIIIDESDIQYDEVAMLKVPVTPQDEGELKVSAEFRDDMAVLVVESKERLSNPPASRANSIKGWDFINLSDQWYVCFYDPIPESPKYGYLLVNIGHPLNKYYFGENPTKDSVRDNPLAMTYLCEILTNETLDFAYKQQLQEEKTGGSSPFTDDSHEYVKRFIGQKKKEIGPRIHEKWLNQRK